ncbi:hypothetical protein C8Q80DRAFT_794012 [Daedaleopsis nitida]|nr:hypothetical protein C8Q80DRAFT_794012 [Daedaleopsis nitida]
MAQDFPSTAVSNFILTNLGPPSTEISSSLLCSRLSPQYLLGSFLSIAGAGFRAWSYHTLGRLFTIKLSWQKALRLVTTGPYAYVRHPSYTGGTLVLLGNTIRYVAPGSHLVNIGVWRSVVGQVTTCTVLGHWAYMCAMMLPHRAMM